jgi:hypothetical protein
MSENRNLSECAGSGDIDVTKTKSIYRYSALFLFIIMHVLQALKKVDIFARDGLWRTVTPFK